MTVSSSLGHPPKCLGGQGAGLPGQELGVSPRESAVPGAGTRGQTTKPPSGHPGHAAGQPPVPPGRLLGIRTGYTDGRARRSWKLAARGANARSLSKGAATPAVRLKPRKRPTQLVREELTSARLSEGVRGTRGRNAGRPGTSGKVQDAASQETCPSRVSHVTHVSLRVSQVTGSQQAIPCGTHCVLVRRVNGGPACTPAPSPQQGLGCPQQHPYCRVY